MQEAAERVLSQMKRGIRMCNEHFRNNDLFYFFFQTLNIAFCKTLLKRNVTQFVNKSQKILGSFIEILLSPRVNLSKSLMNKS